LSPFPSEEVNVFFSRKPRIALVPQPVLDGEEIVSVLNDYDGDWVCYGHTDVPLTQVAVVHRKHLFQLDATMRDVPRIPPGHIARRDGRGSPWRIDPPEMTREEWLAS